MGYEDEELDDVQALLQAISIQDLSVDIADMLKECGFMRVRVTQLADLPEHAWEWLGEGWDESEFSAALQETMESDQEPQYWRVETSFGDFGLFWAGQLLVDLTESGVEPFQLDPSLTPPCPKFCLVEGEDTLVQLCAIMEFDRELEMIVEEAEQDDY